MSSQNEDGDETDYEDDAVEDELKQELKLLADIQESEIDQAINDYRSSDARNIIGASIIKQYEGTISAMVNSQEEFMKVTETLMGKVQNTGNAKEDSKKNNVIQQIYFDVQLSRPGLEKDKQLYYAPATKADKRRRKVIYKRCLRKWNSDLKRSTYIYKYCSTIKYLSLMNSSFYHGNYCKRYY
jgi:hypothetical protein